MTLGATPFVACLKVSHLPFVCVCVGVEGAVSRVCVGWLCGVDAGKGEDGRRRKVCVHA